ncbi:MAG: Arc family DNA-binding protein [Leptospiraceae bacterium]|nr:Arc family DNA-binding protein [Leptospiraceae bacterium]
MNISLKDVPDELHEKIKERARRSHRSINSEIIYLLETLIEPRSIDYEAELLAIQTLRNNFKGLINDEELNRIKRDGRK